MRRRHGRVNRWVLAVMALVALVMFWFVTKSARSYRTRMHAEKLASAKLAGRAFEVVKEYREQLGIPIDTVNDPNRTGLVGVQFSQVTYGRSDLSDALSSLNPNFAAALVELLLKAGVRPGDTVGISWDGTYPALNIQLLAVAQCFPFEPVIITAQSAGTWGANYPGLTWLDIEGFLRGKGVWSYRSALATLGGETDDGRGLSPAGREMLEQVAQDRLGGCFVPATFRQGVERRLELLGGVRAVVSVGRVIADVGDPLARVPSRVLRKPTERVGPDGVIAALLDKGVPVVFLGNPSRVAIDYGLPVAPVPLPEVGKGRLFFQRRYSVVLAAVFALVLLVLLLLVVRYDIEWYFGAGRHRPDEEAV